MLENDIASTAQVHAKAFPRQTYSKEWLECAFNAFPKTQCFVAEQNNEIVGFVFWTEKSGFRKDAYLELEQGAVDPNYQGKGICTALVSESLSMVASKISERGAQVKNIIVNTRVDNEYALRICKNILRAKQVAVIPGLFTADEVYLMAQDIEKLIETRQASQNICTI
jgi:ribosomal protein S18 acetylase RimI-like enzyme